MIEVRQQSILDFMNPFTSNFRKWTLNYNDRNSNMIKKRKILRSPNRTLRKWKYESEIKNIVVGELTAYYALQNKMKTLKTLTR